MKLVPLDVDKSRRLAISFALSSCGISALGYAWMRLLDHRPLLDTSCIPPKATLSSITGADIPHCGVIKPCCGDPPNLTATGDRGSEENKPSSAEAIGEAGLTKGEAEGAQPFAMKGEGRWVALGDLAVAAASGEAATLDAPAISPAMAGKIPATFVAVEHRGVGEGATTDS
jgi:hypothetical protein